MVKVSVITMLGNLTSEHWNSKQLVTLNTKE